MAKKEVKVSEEKTAAPAFYPLSTLRGDIDTAFERMFRDWPRFGKLADFDPFREMDFWKRPSASALFGPRPVYMVRRWQPMTRP